MHPIYSLPPQQRRVQIIPEMVGICGMNPFHRSVSPSRAQMFSNHLSQTLVIAKPTEKYIQSGMERQYAKTTYSVKMPETGTIIDVISRYRRGNDAASIPPNEAQTIVIYQVDSPGNPHDGEIDMFEIKGYHFEHAHFGWRYEKTEAFELLTKGANFEKGTVFLKSPSVTENGDYRYGRESNVAFMSHPAIAEDGIVICRDVLHHFATKTYEKREIEWGSRFDPLNLYGDDNTYRIFPEIGSIVPAHGKLMTLRRYERNDENPKLRNQYYEDRTLALTQRTRRGLQRPCNYFDKSIYAPPGGRIVDIRVYHDDASYSGAPPEFEEQVSRYQLANREFYNRLLEVHRNLKRRYTSNLNISKELHGLLVEAIGGLGPDGNKAADRVIKQYRTNPMDDWRVEFTIEYTTLPSKGSKFTGESGDKGVICYIAEPEEMPVDQYGRRADFIMDGRSTINRMNPGRNFEQYFNAASADVIRRLEAMLGVKKHDHDLYEKIAQWEHTENPLFTLAWDYLMGYFKNVSEFDMYPIMTDGTYTGSKSAYLAYCIEHWIILYCPVDSENDYPTSVNNLELDPQYRPHHGPVTYRGYSGIPVTTVENIRIAPIYILMLEKIGDDYTATSTGKRQHFGVLSQLTSWDKYAQPTRTNAVRAVGETELRIDASHAGPEHAAERMDRSNNPATSRIMADAILKAKQPSNIDRLIDRKLHPFGGAKPNVLAKHMASVFGFEFVYMPYQVTDVPEEEVAV